MEHRSPLPPGPGAPDGYGAWLVPALSWPLPDPRPAGEGTHVDRGSLKQATLDARTALQEAAVAAAVAAQRAMTYAEMLDEALMALNRAEAQTHVLPASTPPRAAFPAAALSPREKEVLALVAEGRSNKAIAEALSVSPNTVKTHVASLLNKLHADSRAHLAAMAVRGAAW